MLALPVTSAPTGLIPCLSLMVVVWLMMMGTGLCLVELGCWMKRHDAHILTMSRILIGPWGASVVWCLFLFISYASLTAYTAECGHLLARAIEYLFGYTWSKQMGAVLFACIFGPFILGPRLLLGRANDVLFFLMIVSYVVFIANGLPQIHWELLLREDWSMAYMAIPLLITSFSFQTMVPSLHSLLNNHKKSLQAAVILGTTIAFGVYALWLLVILGSVSLEGPFGLKNALESGVPATHCLTALTHSVVIPYAASFFSLFALATSFFGLGVGLFDFLSDGLNIPKKGLGTVVLGLLVVVPSLFFAITYERIFIVALDVSGGFGDTVLNGLVPIALLLLGIRRYWPDHKKTWCRNVVIQGVASIGFFFFMLAFASEVWLRFMSSTQTG